ncbi:LPS export ABC transporter periplasmic protein LptC [Aliikangiella marina]|uniref:LPS export ABC transporter periplasmic protein LptC n=1 Tax=Aliikangiella marina TaxID=1712262 RepID=A0A545T6L5_9GAMM|nr:LPS export ABC transporter periplasmic protein LptC [Aliikangiella marina]TQV72870.1 LPS export ABC transporter periplasmic protein LptC [Aliikangiella marina]
MRKRTKAAILASITAIILSVNYWQPSVVTLTPEATELSDADYYFQDVKVKQYASSGKIESQLSAVKMEHYKLDDYSEIVQPRIIIMSDNQSAWQISAETGKLSHKTNQLELKTNTRLFRKDTIQSGELKTDTLLIDMANNIASTRDQVIIENANTRTIAKGMDARFKEEQIELQGPVETVETSNE